MKITKAPNKITIEFEAIEAKILKDSIANPLNWLETAINEKLANCRARLIREWLGRLQANKAIPAIPTDDAELLTLIFAQPDYLDRQGRDAAGE